MSTDKPAISGDALPGLFASAFEYLVDTGQRSVLFLDVMRQRGTAIPRTSGRNRASCPRLCRRIDHRRQNAEAAGELCAGARRSAERRGDRSQAPSVRRGRSSRRPRAGDRRLQGGQRDRRRDEGRSPLLLHRLPARADARPDDRGHRPSRGGLHRKSHRPASGSRRQAMRDRQLPGRLGGHDPGLAAAGAVRPDDHRRRAVVLLGRRPRQEPDALFGRPAGRKLADRADQRSRRRQVRRRVAGPEFREHESLEHALDQAVQRLFEGRHRGGSLSRVRALVGRACQPECRGDPVHRR